MKYIKLILAIIVVLVVSLIYIADTESMVIATANGINVCLTTIIPSLFGFMVISTFVINSNLHVYIFKPLYFVLKHIIRVSSDEFGILLLSLIGGYPVGAKLVIEYISYNRNYSAMYTKKLSYLYCGSPTFIISIVGIGIFGSVKVGLLVYLSNALACIIYAVLLNIRNEVSSNNENKQKTHLSQDVFISSVLSSGKALFSVCLTVILFTILIQIFKSSGIYNYIGIYTTEIINSIIEISNIRSLSINSLPIIAAITSFGGICILMQVKMIVKNYIKLKYFMLSRLPIALLSGVICFLLTKDIECVEVIKQSTQLGIRMFSKNPIASVSIIIMILIITLSMSGVKNKSNN